MKLLYRSGRGELLAEPARLEFPLHDPQVARALWLRNRLRVVSRPSMSWTVTTSDARTNARPAPSSGTTSTQSPSAEVPIAPNLLIHSSASLTPSSRSCFFPFASVMTTFTDREGYAPQDVDVQRLVPHAASSSRSSIRRVGAWRCRPPCRPGASGAGSSGQPAGRENRAELCAMSALVSRCQLAPGPCHAEGRGFESRHPLQQDAMDHGRLVSPSQTGRLSG